MQALVEATLDFARGAAVQEAAVQVDLAAVLADLVRDAAAGEGHATLDAAQPVLAAVHLTTLKRALRNLIDNAIRYGDVARVTLTGQPGLAIITIADDGPGLPEDQLAAVFEPFVRLEASRSHDTGGVGLGLAIARTALQAHGGDVTLRNRAAGGLEAVVRLPVDPA